MKPEMFTMIPVKGGDNVVEFRVFDNEFPRGSSARSGLKQYETLIPQEVLKDVSDGVSFIARGGAINYLESILTNAVGLDKQKS